MEALLPVMSQKINISCCGTKLSSQMPTTALTSWLRWPLSGDWRIWHARRNNDMLAGLVLKYVLGQRLILLWTSAAQRKHSWLTRFCYRNMDAVVATTQKAASYLQCPSEVSHHGVDTSVYFPTGSRSEARTELGLANRPTLGVFGRIRPQKGTCDLVSALLKTLPQHPEWQVVFVGQATTEFVSYQADLQAKLDAANIGDQVHFTGFIQDFAQLPKWYQAMDLVGCVSRNEGFGITCLEAMATECPVIATTSGAWADIIRHDETGWICQANNIADLTEKLEVALSTSPEQLKAMGRAALDDIHQAFTIEHESERLIATYRRLLRERNALESLEALDAVGPIESTQRQAA